MWGKAPPPGTWRPLLPFVKGLFFFFLIKLGERVVSSTSYPLSNLLITAFSAFAGWGDWCVIVCNFMLGAKPHVHWMIYGREFFQGSSYFKQTLDLFDTCIHWLIGIGSRRQEAALLLWIVARWTFYFCHVQNVFDLRILIYFSLSWEIWWWLYSNGVVVFFLSWTAAVFLFF